MQPCPAYGTPCQYVGLVDELLEALVRLTQWEGHHVYCGHGKDDSRPCVCGFNPAYENALNAIAKARGQ